MVFSYQDAIHLLGGDENSGRARERFVSEISSVSAMTAGEAKEMFPDVKFSNSSGVMYFPMKMCHSLPVVNKRGRSFTAKTLANSHASARDALVNIDHELRTNGTSLKDNICGHIVSTAFDKSFQWKESANIPLIPDESIPMYALGVLYTRHTRVPGMIRDHLSGKSKWDVSMECGHSWLDAHLLHGDDFIPFIDAPGDMLECISRNGVKQYRDKRLAIALGGIDGIVDFWGLGMTECPADENAEILSFFAGMQAEAANTGCKSTFLPIKSTFVPSSTGLKLVDKITDTFFNDLASIEVIGKTESAEDGHVHEVLSNGTILPYEGHAHYLDSFSLKKGTVPKFTGQTSTHYQWTDDGRNEKVHIHLIDISLRGKSKSDNSSQDIGVDGDELSSSKLPIDISGDCEVKIEELIKKLESIVNKISTGKSSEGNEIASAIADFKKEFSDLKLENEIAETVKKEINDRIDSGELLTKDKHDELVLVAIKEIKDAYEKEANNNRIIDERIKAVSDLGIELKHVISPKENDEEEDLTVESLIRDISPDNEKEFKKQFAVLKTLADEVKKGSKAKEVVESTSASSGNGSGNKNKTNPGLLVGSPSSETADNNDSKPKIGKHAISSV